MKRSQTASQAVLNAEAQDNLAYYDPEMYRNYMLRVGGTTEEAEAYALWAIRSNARVAEWRREDEAESQTDETLDKAY